VSPKKRLENVEEVFRIPGVEGVWQNEWKAEAFLYIVKTPLGQRAPGKNNVHRKDELYVHVTNMLRIV